MRLLMYRATAVHTLSLRVDLRVAKILEETPFAIRFRHQIQHLILYRVCWRLPTQVAPLLAYFPSVVNLVVHEFTTAEYTPRPAYIYSQAPTLAIRKIRWICDIEPTESAQDIHYKRRHAIASALARALLPNVTTDLEVRDFDPHIIGLLGPAWSVSLERLNIRVRAPARMTVPSRWSAG